MIIIEHITNILFNHASNICNITYNIAHNDQLAS